MSMIPDFIFLFGNIELNVELFVYFTLYMLVYGTS